MDAKNPPNLPSSTFTSFIFEGEREREREEAMPLVSMLSSKAARGRGCVRERAPPLDAHPMRRRWTPLGEGAVLLPPPLAHAVHCSPLGEGAALQPAVHSPP